jgi:hypothetical protein
MYNKNILVKMKDLLKYLGVFIMLIGVVILVVVVSNGVMRNNGLGISALLIIFGMIGFIILNREVE